MNLRFSDEQITQYLLGALPEEQASRFEEEYFADDELFDYTRAIKEELIADYLRRRLTPAQQAQFERHFLRSPQHRSDLELSRAVLQAVAQGPAASPAEDLRQMEPLSFWQRLREWWGRHQAIAWASTVAAVIVVANVWLLLDLARDRRRLAQALAEREAQQQQMQEQLAAQRDRNDRLEKELEQMRDREDPSPPPQTGPSTATQNLLVSLTLSSDFDAGGGGRGPGGGGDRKLEIPPGKGAVRLQLKLTDDGFKRYRAAVQELTSGRTVWRKEGLRAHPIRSGKAVTLSLPASSFAGAASDYLVLLDGLKARGEYEERVDKYSFKVVKR